MRPAFVPLCDVLRHDLVVLHVVDQEHQHERSAQADGEVAVGAEACHLEGRPEDEDEVDAEEEIEK